MSKTLINPVNGKIYRELTESGLTGDTSILSESIIIDLEGGNLMSLKDINNSGIPFIEIGGVIPTTTTTSSTTSTTTLAPTTTTTTVVAQVHKVNVGENNYNFGDVATWQNNAADTETTARTILDQNGVDQGLTLRIIEGVYGSNISKKTLQSTTGFTSSNANFPTDVLIKGLSGYITNGEPAILRISGLTVGSSYTFDVFSTVNEAETGWSASEIDYTSLTASGGSANDSASLNPIDNTSSAMTVTNTANAQGFIDLNFFGNGNFDRPVVNAIIITK